MPYLPSLVLVVVGVVALVAVVIRVVGSLRHFTKVSSRVSDNVGDGVGLLRARSAALGVAFAERRKDQPRVRSTDRGRQEDHRA
ncbi:MAG TPA: bacteriophage holin [Umezawaea sp.]|nr:bacteriophage holin [Umezawaea sp.]